MAALIANSKGYLLVQFYYRGKLRREYLGLRDNRDNRRDALRLVRAIELEIKNGSFDYATRFPNSRYARQMNAARPAAAPRLGEYARKWLSLAPLSEATRRDYESLFRVFLDRTALGTSAINAVSANDLRQIAKAESAAGRTRRVTMFLQRLRTIYKEAVEDGYAEKNPAARVRNPRPGRREPIEPFTDAEVVAMLRAAEGQDRNLIALLLGTGVRPGEALALTRGDIDMKRRRIVVSAAVSRFGGAGPVKTEGSNRVVEIGDIAAPLVGALGDQLSVPRLRGPLFAGVRGGVLNFVNWRRRNWAATLARAGVSYRSPYACRHTFAVRMLEAGHDPVHIARQLGHMNAQMVWRHYARWTNRPSEGKSDTQRV